VPPFGQSRFDETRNLLKDHKEPLRFMLEK
jgi:hypothetical protein